MAWLRWFRYRVAWWRWFLGGPPLINFADPNWNGPAGNYRICSARHDAREPKPEDY